jgi:cell fate (sporulation/competence/biofilm development) regulator YlbF (YheA/YmcA/DUF963 family)
MERTEQIMQAARALGQALHNSPEVQDYLAACQAVQANAELCQLEEQLQLRYQALAGRQQTGEVLSRQEINDFYKLREQVVYHPLVARREECLKVVQASFEQASSSISSILTVDFNSLAV